MLVSWQASQWAVKQRAGSAAAKAILCVLGEAADADGVCWLSQAQIADRAEVSKRTVLDQLAAQERAGLLSRQVRLRKDGSRSSDLIMLALPRVSGGELAAPRGEMVSPSPSEVAALGGEAIAHLTTFEPVNEPASMERPAKPSRKKLTGTALPAHFPDATALARMVKRCAEAGVPCDPAEQAQRFRDHHEAKGTLSASWPASLNTWTSNHIKWSQERRLAPAGGHRPQRSAIDWMMGGLE